MTSRRKINGNNSNISINAKHTDNSSSQIGAHKLGSASFPGSAGTQTPMHSLEIANASLYSVLVAPALASSAKNTSEPATLMYATLLVAFRQVQKYLLYWYRRTNTDT